VLVHLVDVSSAGSETSTVSDLETVDRELERYDPGLAAKPQIVAASKIDALDDRERLATLEAHCRKAGREMAAISSVSGQGIAELLNRVAAMLFDDGADGEDREW
jgi:GTP-binding protein